MRSSGFGDYASSYAAIGAKKARFPMGQRPATSERLGLRADFSPDPSWR